MVYSKYSDSIVEKLNDKNYPMWKFKKQMLLTAAELFDVINDEIAVNPDEVWRKRDRKARKGIN